MQINAYQEGTKINTEVNEWVIVQYRVPNSCSMHIGSQILKHAEYCTDCCLLQEKQQNDSNCQVKVV